MNNHEIGNLVQYIIVRNDVGRQQSGLLSTTVAASSTAAVHLYSSPKHNEEYLKTWINMSRIVLEVKMAMS